MYVYYNNTHAHNIHAIITIERILGHAEIRPRYFYTSCKIVLLY